MSQRTGIRLPMFLRAALLVVAGVVAGPATPAAAASTHDQDYVQRVFHAFLDRAALPWIDAGTRIVMGPDSVIRTM